jgi:hypothetical protein
VSNFKMDDYVPVNERIGAFKTEHPEGSLQSKIVELTEGRVTVMAMAYRTPDDPRPGVGHSSLEIPGSTPFTRGSEIENAETSAWGRAIAALGFEVKRGVSSAEEVRNKQPEQGRGARASSPDAPAPVQRSPEEQALIGQLLEVPMMTVARMTLLADAVGVEKGERANADQLRAMLERATQPGAGVPPAPADTANETGGEDARSSSPTPTPDDEVSVDSSPATDRASVASSPGDTPDPASLMEDVLAVTGGEEIPPKPGTKAYGALQPHQKAAARAYWAEHKEAEQGTLAEALGAPGSDR